MAPGAGCSSGGPRTRANQACPAGHSRQDGENGRCRGLSESMAAVLDRLREAAEAHDGC
jgi:hypothetical protein